MIACLKSQWRKRVERRRNLAKRRQKLANMPRDERQRYLDLERKWLHAVVQKALNKPWDEATHMLVQQELAEYEVRAVQRKAWAEVLAELDKNSKSDNAGIPNFGLKLVPFLVPRKLRDPVIGDLEEDFRKYATLWGRPYALIWLYWELGGLFLSRFGPKAIIVGIAMWVRQKFGV